MPGLVELLQVELGAKTGLTHYLCVHFVVASQFVSLIQVTQDLFVILELAVQRLHVVQLDETQVVLTATDIVNAVADDGLFQQGGVSLPYDHFLEFLAVEEGKVQDAVGYLCVL